MKGIKNIFKEDKKEVNCEKRDWKDIHSDFTLELQKDWEKAKFDYEQVSQWIGIGLSPREVGFSVYLQGQGYSPEQLVNDNSYVRKQKEKYIREKKWSAVGISPYSKNQEDWKSRGFDSEKVKEWLDVGLNIEDAEYAQWLRDIKGKEPQLINNEQKLREEYCSCKQASNSSFLQSPPFNHCKPQQTITNIIHQFQGTNWTEIHPGFTDLLKTQWESESFCYNQVKEWIGAGLNPNDANFASYLKELGYIPQAVLGYHEWLKKTREEYTKWKNLGISTFKLQKEWTEKEFSVEQTKSWIEIGLQLKEANFAAYLKSNLERFRVEFNTQVVYQWLDQNFPKGQRSMIKVLNISHQWKEKSWKGFLDLSDFVNLERLLCSNNNLTVLKLNNCSKLEFLNCQNNQLTELDLGKLKKLEWFFCNDNYLQDLILPMRADQLTLLDIRDNNFSEKDLSMFSHLINLQTLYIGNTNQEKVNQGIYNHWIGSLKPLYNLSKLKYLDISNTDINSGVESLPDSLRLIEHSVKERPESRVKEISLQLVLFTNKEKEVTWKEIGFSQEEIKTWMEIGLTVNEYSLAEYLKKERKLDPQKIKDSLYILRNEYNLVWKNIHQNFTPELQKTWEEKGITYEKAKEWIEIGLMPTDNDYICWLRDVKQLDAKWVLNYGDTNKKLKKLYKEYGLCKECKQPNAWHGWCKYCNSSGNQTINEYIQQHQTREVDWENLLEWIPYNRFENVEYLTEGGFGKIYKARWDSRDVALKSLNNFRDIKADFLREITYHKLFKDDYDGIVKCYGISREPETKNYLMVMQYVSGGNLRNYLKSNYWRLNFKNKFNQLFTIAQGLKEIHKKGLIHRDLHIGNILNHGIGLTYITDLGLCQPVNEADKDKIYGVLPYVAPEVLRRKPYTRAADIYSFGIVAYEILSGFPPYYEYAHDEFLATKICQGLRPNFTIKIPQLLEDLIKRCWDAEPTNRPTADDLYKILGEWNYEIMNVKDAEITKQCKEAKKNNNKFLPKRNPNYKIHPSAIYTSRLLNFNNLPEPQNSKEISKQFYSNSLQVDFMNLKIENEDTKKQCDWQTFHPTFTNELTQSWQALNFTPQQVQDWINIGLQPTDYNFCSWLRDTKRFNPEEVLNHYNLEQLNQEFFTYWQEQQQAQIEQPPK